MKKWYIIWTAAVCLFFSGCSNGDVEESAYHFYYVNYDDEMIESSSYEPQAENVDSMMKELTEKISEENSDGGKLYPEEVEILDYSMADTVLTVNLAAQYRGIDLASEILCRAALVKNFVQIPEVSYVQFKIEGEDLLDSRGDTIGLMNAESFLENSGKEITAYQYTELELYFSNETGDKLVKEKRSVYYSSNSPIEKVVVEQLIRGPKENGHFATLSANTGIIGVSVSDGIAYVNLDQKFVAEALAIQEEIPIYSIVDSLVAAGNVSQVQISVNGDTKMTFREDMRLDQMYEANMELVDDGGTK